MTKEQKREYERNWYKTIGADKRKAANRRWRAKAREEFKQLKEDLKCERCGEDNIACLDFHHTDPNGKEYSIGSMSGHNNLEKIKKEIEKCIVLCANCHRKEHAS